MDDNPTPGRAHRDAYPTAEEEEEEEAYWAQIRSEEDYRYCDDPFCACTVDEGRFLKLTGIIDNDGLTRYGERAHYLWNTDPTRGLRR